MITRKLMFISSDRISDWIKKGEVTSRYYNPGNTFSEVHLVLLSDEVVGKISKRRILKDEPILFENLE